LKTPLLLFAGVLAGVLLGAGAVTYVGNSSGDSAGAPGQNGRPGAGRGAGRYTPVVSMAVAEQSAIARTIDVIGEARASRNVAITSEITGIIEEVAIAPGARVSEGDLIVRINDDEQQVALTRARADYPIARANAERYRNLEDSEAASELEAEQAQNAYIAAQAALRAAEVAVSQRRIVAPFSGIIGLSDIEVGDFLRAGDPVTTLDDTSSVFIEFAVPQESASFINIGQPVRAALTSAAAQFYDGKIVAIDSRVDPVSRSLKAEALFENANGRLIPGAVFAVSTTAEGEDAIALPGLALQWDRAGAFVWRRNDDGAAERAAVVVLQRRDDLVLVEGEISAGDVIVSEGADRVRRGSPLPAKTSSSPARHSAPTAAN